VIVLNKTANNITISVKAMRAKVPINLMSEPLFFFFAPIFTMPALFFLARILFAAAVMATASGVAGDHDNGTVFYSGLRDEAAQIRIVKT